MRPSEFEVQALVYWDLRNAGFNVRGEFKIKRPEFGRLGARLVLVIFDGEDMLLIIEVKKSNRCRSTRQGKRYSDLTGVLCIYIRGISEAQDAEAIVRSFLSSIYIPQF